MSEMEYSIKAAGGFSNPSPAVHADERQGCTSASSAEADALCPGRFLAQRGLPEEPQDEEDEATTNGRKIHEALANGNPAGLTVPEAETYTQCRVIEARLVKEFTDYFGPAAPRQELRLWYSFDSGAKHYRHTAKPDFVLLAGQAALIIERKTGYKEKPRAASNEQLRDQIVLVDEQLPIDFAWCAVVQPHVTHKPEVCVYDREAMAKAAGLLRERVVRSWDPNSPRVAGPVQCEHCRAWRQCGEHQAWATSMLPAAGFTWLETPVAAWSPEQRAAFCEKEGILRKWLTDTKDSLKELLKQNPEAIPGFFLKPGAERARVTDLEGLWDRFQRIGGSRGAFLQCVQVIKGDLEEHLRTLTGARGKKLDTAMETLLDGVTEKKQDQPSIKKLKT